MKRTIITGKGKVLLTERIPETDAVEFVNTRQDVETLDLIGACGNTYDVETVKGYMRKPNDDKNIFLSLIHSESETYLGDIRLVHMEGGMGEIGIVINREERGKGYGTDAMKAIIEYAFEKLNLKSVCLRVYDCNPRAKALYERLGFRTVKTVRDGYIISNGEESAEDIMVLKRI